MSRLQGISYRRYRREYEAAQPSSLQQVPLPPSVREAFACPDCDSQVVIPEVQRFHDPECPAQKGLT